MHRVRESLTLEGDSGASNLACFALELMPSSVARICIEFHRICITADFTGEHGAIIPASASITTPEAMLEIVPDIKAYNGPNKIPFSFPFLDDDNAMDKLICAYNPVVSFMQYYDVGDMNQNSLLSGKGQQVIDLTDGCGNGLLCPFAAYWVYCASDYTEYAPYVKFTVTVFYKIKRVNPVLYQKLINKFNL